MTTPLKPVVLLVVFGACLNGHSVKISEAIFTQASHALALGLSPFELIVMFVAAVAILDDGAGKPHQAHADAPPSRTGLAITHAPEILMALACLVPSSSFTWFALATYAGFRAATSSPGLRTGFGFIAALAVVELWSSLAMRIIGPAITPLEAHAIAAILDTVLGSGTAYGNVVTSGSGFSLIILSACSTADGLPKALLSLAAALSFAGRLDTRGYRSKAAILAMAYLGANLARLSVMAASQAHYDWGHGAVGASLFDGAVVALIFALATFDGATSRHARPA